MSLPPPSAFGRRRGPRPRFLFARLWGFIPLTLLLGLTFNLAPVWLRRMGLPMWWMAAGAVVYGGLLTWLILWLNADGLRARKRIASGERLCWRCGYDVRPMGERGICPECGQAFTAAELDDVWSRWVIARRRNFRGRNSCRTDAPQPPAPPDAGRSPE